MALIAQPIPEWTSSIGTNFHSFQRNKPILKIDNNGNLITVGSIFNESNKRDILVVKYSPSGSLIWSKTYNGINNKGDYVNDMDTDLDGNIYVTGKTEMDSFNTDIITIKYDSYGEIKWVNRFDGLAGSIDVGNSIETDSLKNTFITGYTTSDISIGKRLITIKIDSLGNNVWENIYGPEDNANYEGFKIKTKNNKTQILGKYSPSNNINQSIVMYIDSIGNLIQANGEQIMGPMVTYYIDDFGFSYIGTSIEFKVFKISPMGETLWYEIVPTNLPPNQTGDEVTNIIVDSIQNVYISGKHYGGGFWGSSYIGADILTLKYSPSGDVMWSSRYEYLDNNGGNIPTTLALDSELNLYVAGTSQGDMNGGNLAYIVVKYDSNGNEKGTIRYNYFADNYDIITSMVVVDSSNIYVTGITFDNISSFITTQKYSSVKLVGILEPEANAISLNAFPNPFSTSTVIYFPNPNQELFHFQLFNQSGIKIISQNIKGEKIEIQEENLAPGIYIFTLENENRTYNGKIIKSK